MRLLGVRGLYEGFRGCFEEAEPLDGLIEILNYTNGMLMVVEGCGLHSVLLRTFVLENLKRMDDFAKTYAWYVRESTMITLCKELRNLLEVVEDHV